MVFLLLSVLLPMTMMSLRLRISLIVALTMVVWNTLLSGKVTLSSNPLGNRPLTCVAHEFCQLIINAEDCIEAVGGGVMLGFASLLLSLVVLRALLCSTIALL